MAHEHHAPAIAACYACAAECARHKMDHCQACASACRHCADECRRMAGQPPRAKGAAGAHAQ